MPPRRPIAQLPTHEVANTPPHLGDQDLWSQDIVLQEGVLREGAAGSVAKLAQFGKDAGRAEVMEQADEANRHAPELRAFDRYGMRINEVRFHPSYHALQDLAVSNGLSNHAWRNPGPGAHVTHAALNYMLNQMEGGVMCPLAMSYAAVPALRTTPDVAEDWVRGLLSQRYDRRDIPASEKTGLQMGMFMTEKQGGSDVRANSTQAVPDGAGYRLTGHKFFCSAPMSDAFLTLAYAPGGLSCFLVPRFTPDGARNRFYLQRLKDKLGNRSNASSEMELQDTWGILVGPEGRGVRTIIDMVQGTRFYCAFGSAALMRQGLLQAVHHTRHRAAFQRRLIDQPLMQNVLADLALETEAALTLSLRLGRAIDEAEAGDARAGKLARIGTAIAKFWICKRAIQHAAETMECHGGPGYIEESPMPRLYREAPVNSIWEGSGNVICLDVLRALHKDPETGEVFLEELAAARGGNRDFDQALARLQQDLPSMVADPASARHLSEQMAVLWQASLLIRHAPSFVSDGFCSSRLGSRWSGVFGTLRGDAVSRALVDRVASV